MRRQRAAALLLFLGFSATVPARATDTANEEKAEGYLEWRHGDELVVDGQRVRTDAATRFKGKNEAKDLASIPLGYEVKAKGTRRADGSLLAREIEAKPNGEALFEKEVRSLTDQAESQAHAKGRFGETTQDGREQTVGRMLDSGPQVDRVRGIVETLIPPYLEPDDVRIYVIENKEWNAFAMANGSIYVFSGLLNDLDDDEVAIVLGHELVHATHEHTRKQFKKQMWIQLAALGLAGAEEATIDDKNKRAVAQLLTVFAAAAWSNGYGRDLEDQADRVGLRYAYEGGWDITKGPRLWNRFAKKYGESGKVANFFFGDHSLSSARAINLERQLALNYPEGPKPGGMRAVARRPGRGDARAATAPSARPADQGAQALATTPSGPAAPAAGGSGRKEIKPGMTAAEVRALLGKPKEDVVYGSKSSWTYPGFTVIFENGRVLEVKF
jgi:Zn-dependent protease with chaperone function